MSTENAWSIPTVDGDISNANTLRPTQTVGQNDLKQLKEQAYQEGYQQGLAQAQDEINNRLQHLNELIELIEKPAQLIDEEIEAQLLKLVTRVAEQTIKQSLKIEPELIVSMIAAALQEITNYDMSCKLQLNPEDKQFLESDVEQLSSLKNCEVTELASLARGDFMLISDATDIDGRLSSRILGIVDESNTTAS